MSLNRIPGIHIIYNLDTNKIKRPRQVKILVSLIA